MTIFLIKAMNLCRRRRPKKKDLNVSADDFKGQNKYLMKIKCCLDRVYQNAPDNSMKKR